MICGSNKHFSEDYLSRKPQAQATIVDEQPEDTSNQSPGPSTRRWRIAYPPCPNQPPYKLVRLNAVSLHSPSSLYVNIASATLRDIRTLINSGSTNSFLNSRFAQQNNLKINDQISRLGSALRHSMALQSRQVESPNPPSKPSASHAGSVTKSGSCSPAWIDLPLPS